MKHVCLITEKARASVYEIGTYIKQLTECLVGMNDVYLHLINLMSDTDEVEVKDFGTHTEYSFPARKEEGQKYYRDIWHILKLHLKKVVDGDLIVHLNYLHQYSFVECVKNDYPNSVVIVTIHYMSWSFELKGNISYFKSLIHNADTAPNKEVLTSFEEDKKLFGKVDYIVCLSQNTKEILVQDYNVSSDKIKLIYNGLKDESRLLSVEDKKQLKKSLGFSETATIVLFAGRLDPIKGVDILINSFKRVVEKIPNSYLVIVGDGNYANYLKECKYYWSKIVFTGRLDKEDLYKFYQIADIGVMPSMHEQCSYVAIEMLMFNIPLVISTTTGLNEVLDDELNKIKAVEEGENVTISTEDLAETIINCLNRRDRKFRDYYDKKYSLESMYKNMEMLYNTL